MGLTGYKLKRGTIVAGAVRFMLVAGICAAMLGCRKKEPCPRVTHRLAYPYGACEDRLCKGQENPTTVTVKSNTGLTDTMSVIGLKSTFDLTNDHNCGPLGENITLSYEASHFGNQLRLFMNQLADRTTLDFRNENFTALLNMADSTVRCLGGPQPAEDSSKLEILTSLSVGRLSYSPVYKVTNTLVVKRGELSDIETYYYHAQYGIIRFEQKDGTQWDFQW
jgi:hypothetical protein